MTDVVYLRINIQCCLKPSVLYIEYLVCSEYTKQLHQKQYNYNYSKRVIIRYNLYQCKHAIPEVNLFSRMKRAKGYVPVSRWRNNRMHKLKLIISRSEFRSEFFNNSSFSVQYLDVSKNNCFDCNYCCSRNWCNSSAFCLLNAFNENCWLF